MRLVVKDELMGIAHFFIDSAFFIDHNDSTKARCYS